MALVVVFGTPAPNLLYCKRKEDMYENLSELRMSVDYLTFNHSITLFYSKNRI